MAVQGVRAEDWAYQSLEFFSRYGWQGDPDHVANAPFHREIYDILQYRGEAGRKFKETGMLHIEAPREHAKTTIMSVKYPIWRIGRDHDIRIVVVSKTSSFATNILREVRGNIEDNEYVRRVFPDLEADKPWGDEAFQVKRTKIMKMPTFYGVGLGGQLTGMRADLVILDDPYDLNEVQTEAQREKTENWIKSIVMNIIVPGGELVFISTRWHQDDYAGKVIGQSVENGGPWVVKVYKAIQDDGETVLWPNRWPMERLMARKRQVGSLIFECQFNNDPSGFEGALFKESWLTYYDPSIMTPGFVKDLSFVMGVDPAISESPEADRTALVDVACDRRRGDIYVVDVWADRVDFPSQVEKIVERGRRRSIAGVPGNMKIGKIGVESVAYQKALYSSLYREGLPVVEVKHSKRSKLERMLGLQPHFMNGRIRLPDPKVIRVNWYDKFMEEYLSYPRGRHDDILDALEIAVEIGQIRHGKSSMGSWVR